MTDHLYISESPMSHRELFVGVTLASRKRSLTYLVRYDILLEDDN